MANESEEVEQFMANPTLEGFGKLKNKQLIEIGDRYELRLKIRMKKKELQSYCMTMLVEEDIFKSEDVNKLYPPLYRDENELEREREREEKEREREEKEREREEREKEREEREKERKFEGDKAKLLEMQLQYDEVEKRKQREHELELARITQLNALEKIDKEQEVKKKLIPGRDRFLMPVFSEDDVEGFFIQFEKIAKQAEWPATQWTMMVQAVLVGKAQLVYASLSESESSKYQVVKEEVLKAYELVPEAYRQKFRSLKKGDSQSHLDFAREKSKLFDRWCSSKAVDGVFEKLRQLVLVEEFKWKVHESIRCYLNEKEVDTLSTAAKIADEYALTHKKLVSPHSKPSLPRYGNHKPFNTGSNSGSSAAGGGKGFEGTKPSGLFGKSAGGSGGFKSKGPVNSGDVSCKYCRVQGHVIDNCPVLERKKKREQEATQLGVKPNCLVTVSGTHLKGGLNSTILKSSPLLTGNCSELKGLATTLSEKPSPPVTSANSCNKVTAKDLDNNPFVSSGQVSIGGSKSVPIQILRDTGASQSLLVSSVLDPSTIPDSDDYMVCKGISGTTVSVPLHTIHLQSDLVTGDVTIGLIPDLPMTGISLLLGNDLAGGKVVPCVELTSKPIMEESCEVETYPACVVTRSMSKRGVSGDGKGKSLITGCEVASNDVDLADTVFTKLVYGDDDVSYSREKLKELQKRDEDLSSLRKEALSESEIKEVPVGYFLKDGILMRKYRPPEVPATEEWSVIQQVVVPKPYRSEIMAMAHDLPVSGHLGVKKTTDRILRQFFWPGINSDVRQYCKSCHTCQVVGKYQADPPVAPLHPIPVVGEPFSRVVIDCVGPLPRTRSGNQYILTIMCTATRFPEGIPVRNIKTRTISKVLLKFFTTFGLPKEIQSDQGSNFTAREFKQVMENLGVKQVLSSAYHPESQGVLERFHSTLKTMMRTYCLEHDKDWDEGVPLLLFAVREVVQESLGYSPFEMVFGHQVRGPLSLLSEQWTNAEVEMNVVDYIHRFKEKLQETWTLAKKHLVASQSHMKTWYDKKARSRRFKPGEQVLVLFPVQSNPLQARFQGPYVVEKQMGDLNYLVRTPDRRKKLQLCHVNMLKTYVGRSDKAEAVVGLVANAAGGQLTELSDADGSGKVKDTTITPNCKLSNSKVLSNLDEKLKHLSRPQRDELKQLLLQYETIFPDVPGRTTAAVHDVDVGDSKPIKQHAYRLSPDKVELSNKEVQYMLDHGIIQPSTSSWSSPCVLVPKPDGSIRFCTDYRKLNAVTKTDVYPIPRIDDCIDRIGSARYLSKIDLLKGYWCVPLTDRAREVSAFVCSAGLFEYAVMPFGMKNAPATFQRMMEKVLNGLSHSYAYIDDVVVRSETWEEHLSNIREVLNRFDAARLTVNLVKSEFASATVSYLGYQIGQAQLAPIEAKVQAILEFAPPTDRKGVRRFLGMIGYYRKFCKNFAQLAIPLTRLLKKDCKFEWTDKCQVAFENLKEILCHYPVLRMPEFDRSFELAIDASDQAAGGVLLQTDKQNESLKHPVAYFSRKFDKHQTNYSTIEKELLALVLAIQHFEVYISGLRVVKVYTDHNPLVFLSRMKNKNRRLLNWSLLLQEYNLDIHHIKGVDNVIADALSRC